jgi:hypothetical protein
MTIGCAGAIVRNIAGDKQQIDIGVAAGRPHNPLQGGKGAHTLQFPLLVGEQMEIRKL